ncbi:MAG: sigma-70 family RNA polymerase sigma factor [Pseudomonadota bacterium]
MDDEAGLILRCTSGDDDAMRQLYQRHAGRVVCLAQRLLGDRSEAEDVLQDCFLKAWRGLKQFRGESSLGTWLYRIATNLCRDRLRQRRPPLPADELSAPPPPSSDVLARRQLERALGQLPEGYREVLVMHDVMELEHAEIAAVLGIEVGTSKSQLHKARARMRVLLQQGNGGAPRAADKELPQ